MPKARHEHFFARLFAGIMLPEAKSFVAIHRREACRATAAHCAHNPRWHAGQVRGGCVVGAASQGVSDPFEGVVVELVAMILASLFVGFLAMVAILYPVLRYGYGCGQ